MKPLTHGSVLIAGCKVSNLPVELRNHPRLIMWDSQDERWAGKELPVNVRAVFTTRFVGHSEFGVIMKEARKRGITIFPCESTGQISKMVKELLNVDKVKAELVEETKEVTELVSNETVSITMSNKGKLIPLIPYIDPTKAQKENAQILFEKAKEMKIDTSLASVTNLIYRKTTGYQRPSGSEKTEIKVVVPEVRTPGTPELDTTVAMFDDLIERVTNMRAELVDMRNFLVAVTEENATLKKRIKKFKNFLDTGEE